MVDLVAMGAELIKSYGLIGYFLVVLFGSTVPIIPVEVVLLLALAIGFDPFIVWLLTTVGSTLGAFVIFYVSCGLSAAVVKKKGKTFKQAEALVNKYGSIAVFIGAFTPLPFDPIVVVAGALRMSRLMFLFATVLGRGLRFALLVWFGQAVMKLLVF
jgi:membrane protein YqaA with SNARE-associated domain